MKITVRFNAWMTLAILVQRTILGAEPDETGRSWILHRFLDRLEWPPLLVGLVVVPLMLSAWLANMFLIRALWNRLFPRICGWNPIRLCEAYAMSLPFAAL